jgi:acetolactate synthase-1/2/3 large subunit
MVTTMQDEFLDSKYIGTKEDYTAPNFKKIGESYGIKSYQAYKINDIEEIIKSSMQSNECGVIEIQLTGKSMAVSPLLDYSRPFEDMSPYLDRDELQEQMRIEEEKELSYES